MPVILRKFATSAVVAIGVLAFGSAVACEDIAVVSNDGRYMILSGDDLAVKDVGSLAWLGIRTIDGPLPGSTFATAALQVKFFDRDTGNIVIPPSRGTTDLIAHELGRNLRVASDLVVAGDNAFAYGWWLDNGRNDRLVSWRPAETSSRITLLNASAEEIAHWDVTTDRSVGGLKVGCEDTNGRTIIAGLTSRLVVVGDRATLEPLDRADRSSGYQLSGLSLGCSAILVHADKAKANVLRMARIDLARNRVTSEFTTRRMGEWLLFSEGQRMLEQETFSPEAYRYLPTRRARILNTDNGAILKETELPAEGELSRLICRGVAERVVLSAQDKLYLIELETLRVIASKHVPFTKYFVL